MQKTHFVITFFLALFLLFSCKKQKEPGGNTMVDLAQITKNDTLRVATMYGATSYFVYRDEVMGFDYEMANQLAKQLKLGIKFTIAKTEIEMTQLLQERKVDLIAYNIIETKRLKKQFNFVFPQNQSYQVVVQNIGSKAITEVTDLADKTVYVKPNTIFEKRLQDLNEEIGGTIKIEHPADTVTDEQLIEMVASKKIDYTIAYHHTGLLYKSYHRRLDCRLPIGIKQSNGWLVRSESAKLTNAISEWMKMEDTQELQSDLEDKYWMKSPFFLLRKVKIPKGAISPYDKLFKKYAALIKWDWKLLAAIAFHESRFDSAQVSWAGAVGLMQLMPRTALSFGLSRQDALNPELNIEASVQYIKSLNLSFRKVENADERLKFIIAAYNSGPSHIIDAMALAEKYGRSPQIWYDNVEYYLIKKSEPEFYKDPVVKYGVCKSKETINYVENVLTTYDKYCGRK